MGGENRKMKWNIIADSSCDMFELEQTHENIRFATVPFTISVGDENYVDDEKLDTDELVGAMEACAHASHTACPSPNAWYEQFEQEGDIFAITISSNLSGSYNSACAARDMILEEHPERKIHVIDSHSSGAELILLVRKLCELMESGCDFDSIVEKIERYSRSTHVVFALSSFNNLVKNGRMNKLVGFVANKLGFWGIGIGSEQGTIEIKGKVRGAKKALDVILADMKERGYACSEVVISHCCNAEFAETLKNAIQDVWNKAEVTIVRTRGLCSYYAEKGGLIVGY